MATCVHKTDPAELTNITVSVNSNYSSAVNTHKNAIKYHVIRNEYC